MSSIKDLIRSLTPTVLLNWNRSRKKRAKRKELERKRAQGAVWTKDRLLQSFKAAGIDPAKDLMIHSALSRIGFVDEGPKTFVDALLEYMNPEATILMPTSPVQTLQAEHVLDVFDVENTPSKMGAITEYFRAHVASHRSAHPLEPVAAVGPRAEEYTQHHHTEATAYGAKSPWNLHMEHQGQILYVGTTLINSGTSLHAVEDAIGHQNFKFPIYLPSLRSMGIKLQNGRSFTITTHVHNPAMSAKRRCDELIPLLENKGGLKHVSIGEAPTLLVQADKMKSILLDGYHTEGITMYTPQGS